MKAVKTMDNLAAGLVLAGAINWGIKGLTRRDTLSRVARPQSDLARGVYSAFGAAAVYQLARAIGPKTDQEKRLERLEKLYSQIEDYRHRMQKMDAYRAAASEFIKRRIKNLRTAGSS